MTVNYQGELVDVPGGHLRVHSKPARRRRLHRRHRHRGHPGQSGCEPVDVARVSAALPECGRGRSALLRVHDAERSQSELVRRQQDQPAAGVRVGHQNPGDGGRWCVAGAAQPAVPRIPQHQPDPGYGHQSHESVGGLTRARRASTTTTVSRRRTPARVVWRTSDSRAMSNFGNDTNNALDTGFGFANAAVGVSRSTSNSRS